MGVREKHYNSGHLIPRHFFHKDDCGDGCAESQTHERMKVLAYHKLEELFPDASIEYEKHLEPRFADVAATFSEPTPPLGKGVVVEAQFKNKDKDTGMAQRDFFDHGYSVYWMYLSDIQDGEVTFHDHRLRKLWPEGVPKMKSWSGYTQGEEDLKEMGASGTVTVKPPIEYLQAHVFDIYSPEKLSDDEIATKGKAWLHSKTSKVAFWKLYGTPQGNHILEFRTRDRNSGWNDTLHIGINEEGVQQIKGFVSSLDQKVESGEAFEGSDGLKRIVSTGVTGDFPSTGWLSVYRPPGKQMKFTAGRKDLKGNTRSLTVNWRRGDAGRLYKLCSMLDQCLER